ncbi:hypothetical protein F2Q70_00015102 [Brassica cretica]|uniref:Uncharacterized protein n=1 Tax=Brassica cretica TaxID=69181 RepID=A0A8S9I0C8_BRACR|nr:hypothetical protein F2Q70_00015102 [Brassica cretica]
MPRSHHAVTSVQFNPVNENYFMSGSVDGKVRIWNVSGCNVVDWVDLKDIISAVCYRPDGKGGIIGSLSGGCRFFNMSGDYLELDSQIHLLSKKKSSNKRITGFQFLPQDQSKVLVVSADSKVRILQGKDVVRKYKGVCKTRSLTSVSLTSDGKHIVSACEDSNIYIWSNGEESDSSSSQTKKIRSFERFSTNASVAATWCGFLDHNATLPFSSPSCLSYEGFVPGSIPKGSATWPEENLPANPLSSSTMSASHYKFLKSSYQRATNSSLAWGMVFGGYGRSQKKPRSTFSDLCYCSIVKKEIQKQVPPDYDPVEDLSRRVSAQGVPDPSSDVRDSRAAPAHDLFLVLDSIRQLASDDQGIPDQATKDVRDPIEATRSIPAGVPFVSSSRLNSFGGPIQQSSKVKR